MSSRELTQCNQVAHQCAIWANAKKAAHFAFVEHVLTSMCGATKWTKIKNKRVHNFNAGKHCGAQDSTNKGLVLIMETSVTNHMRKKKKD